MYEIINQISSLSIDSPEQLIIESLAELKSSLIQNADLSKSVLNSNFLKSLENLSKESDVVTLLCEILEISLSYLKLQGENDFLIIEKILELKPFSAVAVKKLQSDCREISAVPKSTILSLINCLKSRETNVGPPAIKLLTQFLTNDLLDDGDIRRELVTCTESSVSEVKCRIYEVAIGMSAKGFSFFEKIQILLGRCLNDLQHDDDVLLQLNLLEILQNLCSQDYGLHYLENKGVLHNFARKIERISDDPLTNALLVPGLMKFFANIAALNPEKIFQNYPILVDLLFELILNGDDFSLIFTALDTFGSLSKFDEGKKLLDSNYSEMCCQIVSHIFKNVSNYPSDIKPRALFCLENVFWVNDEEMINNQISYICQKWCNSIFKESDFTPLLNYCCTPFEDISLSAFGLLKSLVKHPFGQRGVCKTGGFVEFLLDRRRCSNHVIRQKKFEIIETLTRSNEFDATTTAQLCKYVREGINFVEPECEIEVQEN